MEKHMVIELPFEVGKGKNITIYKYNPEENQIQISVDGDIHVCEIKEVMGTYILKYNDRVYFTKIYGKKSNK